MTYDYRYNFSVLMQNFHEAENFLQESYEDKENVFDEICSSFNTNDKEKLFDLLGYFISCIHSEITFLDDFRVDLTDASTNSIQHLIDDIFQTIGIIQEFNDVFIISPHNLALEGTKILNNCMRDLTLFKEKITSLEETANLKEYKKEFISILQKYSYKNQSRLQELNKYLYTKIEILIEKLKLKVSDEVKDQILELLFIIISIKGFFLFIGIFLSPNILFYTNLVKSSLIGLIISSNIPDFKDSREFKKWLQFLEEYFEDRDSK